MRCPDCNKFVSYDEPEVELQDASIDSEGRSINGSVRIMLPCGECSQELKDAELEFDISFDHECPEGTKPWPEDADEDQFELDGDPDVEGTDRMQTHDRHGKRIKSYRYMRHYIGADVTATVKCNACGESWQETTNVEEMASCFNELV